MKSIFLSFGLMVCSVVSIVIVMTLCGISIRTNELNDAVDIALHSTVENQMDETTYSVESNEAFIADFLQVLLVQIQSDSAIEVNVLDVDYEKGLLSVEVISKYQHPFGTEGQVAVRRTVIMEQYEVPID